MSNQEDCCKGALRALAPFFVCNQAEQRCEMACSAMRGAESAALCNHWNVSRASGVDIGPPVEDGPASWACLKRGTLDAELEACFGTCAKGRCVEARSPWFWVAVVVGGALALVVVGGALYYAFRAHLDASFGEEDRRKERARAMTAAPQDTPRSDDTLQWPTPPPQPQPAP